MAETVETYLEVGTKRVFAGAVQWPGWCRSGRDEDGAMQALIASAARYASAIIAASTTFLVPDDASALTVVERLEGKGGTDFGVPSVAGSFDERPLDALEADRQLGLLQCGWAAFDAAAASHSGAELRKGPRGGGRDVAGIVEHVLGAEAAYLTSLGGHGKVDDKAEAFEEMARLRTAAVEVWQLRVNGEDPPRIPTRGGTLWALRYWARRSAWHALDHAWEIEDRLT